MSEIKVPTSTFPVVGLLGATLVILKLLGHIDLAWWLVLLPFWIGPAIALGVLLAVGVIAGGAWAAVHIAVGIHTLLRSKKSRRG